ncbi:hypothetical protein PIB30_022562 [Stylosanthes scabra]|uniref:Uncharacterized protein n=1 Tax=Stylosanthes scabra TaxID=79078 RepID=A0ABU6YB66_9FABA|nr:hypothetical protein [Stylosanthes scabra]
MLEDIRVYLMNRWADNRESIIGYSGDVLPKIKKEIEKEFDKGGDWMAIYARSLEMISMRFTLLEEIETIFRTPIDRPRKSKNKAADEPRIGPRSVLSRDGQVQKCSYCFANGHNKRTCPKKRKVQLGSKTVAATPNTSATSKRKKPQAPNTSTTSKRKKPQILSSGLGSTRTSNSTQIRNKQTSQPACTQ